MKYISIPVHERIEVIVNQLQNFKRFLPRAMVVLHVSQGATFKKMDLYQALNENKIDSALINPNSVQTSWGGIILAHFENIEFIKSLGNASHIIFHSSNDMLVRDGLDDYLSIRDNIFNHRVIQPNSYWWVGNEAFVDATLSKILSPYGSGLKVASQIEGSMYQAELLYDIVKHYKNSDVFASQRHYPREEVFLSSLACAFDVKSDGLPYIFSEVHRFDRKLWQKLSQHPERYNEHQSVGRRRKNKLNKKIFNSGFYKISPNDVNSIHAGDTIKYQEFEMLNDGHEYWKIFDHQYLFGVKRVERLLSDPIRKMITDMQG